LTAARLAASADWVEWQVRVEDMKGLFSVTWLIYICFLPVHLCFSPSLLSGSVLASEWISNPQNQADDPKARAKKAEEEAKRREELLKKKASQEELEIRRQRNDQVSLQHSILFPTLRALETAGVHTRARTQRRADTSTILKTPGNTNMKTFADPSTS